MKKYLLLAALLPVAAGVMAQSKMDIGSRARLRGSLTGWSVSSDGPSKVLRKNPVAAPAVLRGFVTLAPGFDASALDGLEGIVVTGGRGSIVLVEATHAAVAALDSCDAVASVSIERPLAVKLDKARAASHIDEIHEGIDLPQAYTGKGVVAGIVDGGFDPNHINFKNEDGTSRISKFTYYRPTSQSGVYVEEHHDASYIPQIDTEDDETYHGTHTLGIMAGSYRGNVKAGRPVNGFFGSVEEMPNPYYGVACDADLAVACGALSDYYIAMGVESILNYAYEQQKPAVVNLSLGSNVGPHDGSSTICQYLDFVSSAGQDRVIFCVSSGNEGDLPIALNKRFNADDNSVGTFLYPGVAMQGYQNVRYGQTYIYSDTDTPFEVQAVIVNKTRNAVAMRMPLAAVANSAQYWVSSSDWAADETDVVSAQMARYLVGYVGLLSSYDENTGRYYAVLDCMAWDNTSATGSNAKGNYVLGFVVKGAEGQRVDIFNDGVWNNFSSYGLEGYSDGMTDGTISDVATGFNTVVVGSYNTRDEWASLDANIYGYAGTFPEGKMSSFTSYGTLCDGRTKPDVCAPGAAVISSSNQYFLNANAPGAEQVQAQLEADGRLYSWHQSVGTSMSTPLVAGSIALWLEACPDLTYEEVKQIIRETSTVDTDVLESGVPVQWGAGKFNAYAGLKKALEMASVTDVAVDSARPVVAATGDRSFVVTAPLCDNIRVDVYDVAGRLVTSASASVGTVTIELSAVPAGVYLFNVNGRHTSRILVK